MVARTLGVAAGAGARVTVTFVAGVFGLVIGSFLNVVVYRVPRDLSVVQPGSFCPACGTPIRSSDNVPVISWLVLRAKCRHCREPISPRYPTVEFLTGALFAALAWVLGPHWAVPGMCVLGATALALAVIELDGLPPPGAVSLTGTGIGAVALGAAAVADKRWWHLGGMLIGIAAASCVGVAGSWAARRRAATVSLWALIPAGAVMGWVGAPGTVIGVAGTAVVLVGSWIFLGDRRRQDGSGPKVGMACAGLLGAGAAVIGAFVVGSSIGV